MAPVALASSTRSASRSPALVDAPPQHGGHLGVAPGGDERLEQQRLAVVELVGDEVGADGGEDVGGLALEAVLGEELRRTRRRDCASMAASSSSALPRKRP